MPDHRSQTELALKRLAREIGKRADRSAHAAVRQGHTAHAADTDGAIDQHATRRRYVHGVGPAYVAKTTHPSQFVRWNEIVDKPVALESPGAIEIDAHQIVSGTIPVLRLPIAPHDATDGSKIIGADDPRITHVGFVMTTGAAIAAGSFVTAVIDANDAVVCVPAQAGVGGIRAIGFIRDSAGVGDDVIVYPNGDNPHAALIDAQPQDVNRTVYLAHNAPGQISLVPFYGDGALIQPLGSIVEVVSGTRVRVLVRYTIAVVAEAVTVVSEPSDDKHFMHHQAVAAATWTITHNLHKRPSVAVVDSADDQVYGDVRYLDDVTLQIRFSAPFAGKAYCN